MNGTLFHHWQFAYLAAALLVAAAAAALAGRRSQDPPAWPTRCATAAVAGALWPVMLIGLVQLVLIARLNPRRTTAAPVAPTPRRALVAAGSRWAHGAR